MKTTAHDLLPTTAPAGQHTGAATAATAGDRAEIEATERRRIARASLKSRHTSGLSRLMEERNDLRGVHALADFVDESLRWTA